MTNLEQSIALQPWQPRFTIILGTKHWIIWNGAILEQLNTVENNFESNLEEVFVPFTEKFQLVCWISERRIFMEPHLRPNNTSYGVFKFNQSWSSPPLLRTNSSPIEVKVIYNVRITWKTRKNCKMNCVSKNRNWDKWIFTYLDIFLRSSSAFFSHSDFTSNHHLLACSSVL